LSGRSDSSARSPASSLLGLGFLDVWWWEGDIATVNRIRKPFGVRKDLATGNPSTSGCAVMREQSEAAHLAGVY